MTTAYSPVSEGFQTSNLPADDPPEWGDIKEARCGRYYPLEHRHKEVLRTIYCSEDQDSVSSEDNNAREECQPYVHH